MIGAEYDNQALAYHADDEVTQRLNVLLATLKRYKSLQGRRKISGFETMEVLPFGFLNADEAKRNFVEYIVHLEEPKEVDAAKLGNAVRAGLRSLTVNDEERHLKARAGLFAQLDKMVGSVGWLAWLDDRTLEAIFDSGQTAIERLGLGNDNREELQ